MYIFYAVSPGLNQGPLAAAAAAPGRYFPIKNSYRRAISKSECIYICTPPSLFFHPIIIDF